MSKPHDADPARLRKTHTLPIMKPRAGTNPYVQAPDMPAADLAGLTHPGLVRERNEDQFVVAELNRWARIRASSGSSVGTDAGCMQGLLLAVADGMGGHDGGDMASAVALDTLVQYALYAMQWYAPGAAGDDAALANFGEAGSAADARVREVAERKQMADGRPGTTLTVSYIVWPDMFVLHIGDSRCYLLRDGRLSQISRDHTIAQAIADGAQLDPRLDKSSPLAHMLSRCVGGGDSAGAPDLWRVRMRAGDCVLLCSDGLTRHVPDAAIADHLAVGDAGVCCGKLVDAANDDGGHDNVTVAIAKFAAPTRKTV